MPLAVRLGRCRNSSNGRAQMTTLMRLLGVSILAIGLSQQSP